MGASDVATIDGGTATAVTTTGLFPIAKAGINEAAT